MNLRWGQHSIVGNVRENNEDRVLADDEGRYFLVADGMGGQMAGEKASELAVEIIPRKLSQTIDFENEASEKVIAAIEQAVALANGEIMALGEVDPRYYNMGTTIVFMVRVGESLFLGGIGDSRAYRLRGKKFEQLTTDHSVAQALVDAGTISRAEAATHRFRNALYRYLGTKEGNGDIDVKEVEPKSGDRFVLCTDGVTDGLDDDSLKDILQEHDDPQEAAEALVEAALKAGSKDNITCLVVHVD